MTKSKSYSKMLKSELLEAAKRLGLCHLDKLLKEEIIDLIIRAEERRGKQSSSSPSASIPSSTHVGESSRKSNVAPVSRKPGTRTQTPPTSVRSARPDSLESFEPKSSKTLAPSSKFAPEELRDLDERLAGLPESYEDNRIVLLPRDPTWLFTYWDLAQEYKEAARQAGGTTLALRLFDVTGIDFDGTNGHAMYEHECAEWARSWYLPVPAPHREYLVEIGYRGDGGWFPLTRSNKVSVPPNQPSTWVQERLATIRFDESLADPEVRARASLDTSPPLAAPGGQVLFDDGSLRIVAAGVNLGPHFPGSFSGSRQPLPSEHFPGSLGQTVPGSAGELVASLPGSVGVSLAGSAAWSGSLAGSAGSIPGSAGSIPGSAGELFPGSLGQAPGSGELFPGSLGPYRLGPALGYPAPPSIPGTPENPPARPVPATPLVGGAPAPEAALPPPAEPPRPLLVQAQIELIVSGRSLPGVELSIAGRSIPVGPDGCFSLRLSVPEGVRELPIEARGGTSGEEQVNRIHLRFGRETE
jgi:hypothetical protein